MLSNDTHMCTHNFNNDEICFEKHKNCVNSIAFFLCLNQFLKKLNLSKWMNVFYLRYYIDKTIGKAIGDFFINR